MISSGCTTHRTGLSCRAATQDSPRTQAPTSCSGSRTRSSGSGRPDCWRASYPVNDVATVPLMIAVHGRLREGATLAQALHQARRWLGASDIVVAATGLSFVALGGA